MVSYKRIFQKANPNKIPAVMYGIAGYAFPFLVTANKYESPMSAPKIMLSAAIIPNER